jgi:copper chaperone CopZ
MKKTYKLENLGCANCLAKMEDKISKLKGVEEASVNFFAGKLNLQISDEIILDELEKEIEKIIKKIEPQVKLKEL